MTTTYVPDEVKEADEREQEGWVKAQIHRTLHRKPDSRLDRLDGSIVLGGMLQWLALPPDVDVERAKELADDALDEQRQHRARKRND